MWMTLWMAYVWPSKYWGQSSFPERFGDDLWSPTLLSWKQAQRDICSQHRGDEAGTGILLQTHFLQSCLLQAEGHLPALVPFWLPF